MQTKMSIDMWIDLLALAASYAGVLKEAEDRGCGLFKKK
jgi:hypothetical protein